MKAFGSFLVWRKGKDLPGPAIQTIYVVVQLLSLLWLFATPWTAALQATPSFTSSRLHCWLVVSSQRDFLKDRYGFESQLGHFSVMWLSTCVLNCLFPTTLHFFWPFVGAGGSSDQLAVVSALKGMIKHPERKNTERILDLSTCQWSFWEPWAELERWERQNGPWQLDWGPLRSSISLLSIRVPSSLGSLPQKQQIVTGGTKFRKENSTFSSLGTHKIHFRKCKTMPCFSILFFFFYF